MEERHHLSLTRYKFEPQVSENKVISSPFLVFGLLDSTISRFQRVGKLVSYSYGSDYLLYHGLIQ